MLIDMQYRSELDIAIFNMQQVTIVSTSLSNIVPFPGSFFDFVFVYIFVRKCRRVEDRGSKL